MQWTNGPITISYRLKVPEYVFEQMFLILHNLISLLSTLHPVPACEVNTHMTSMLYHCPGCTRAHTQTPLHTHLHEN